jgi:hypothetical protein
MANTVKSNSSESSSSKSFFLGDSSYFFCDLNPSTNLLSVIVNSLLGGFYSRFYGLGGLDSFFGASYSLLGGFYSIVDIIIVV